MVGVDVHHLNFYHQKRGYFGINVDKLEDEENQFQAFRAHLAKQEPPQKSTKSRREKAKQLAANNTTTYTQLTEPIDVFTFDFNSSASLSLSGTFCGVYLCFVCFF
jgi:hypothetical protein